MNINKIYFKCYRSISLRSYFLTSVLMFCIVVLSAQETENFNNRIVLKSLVSGDSVKLRWVPGNIEIWRSALEHGYTISRIDNDETFTISQKYSTKIILAEALKPVTEDQWSKYLDENDTLGIAAKNLIYNSDLLVQPKEKPSLHDAVNYKKNEEGRFFFMIMLAEQRYKIAEAYGLAFTDLSAEQGKTYQYMVTLTDTSSQNANYGMGIADVSFGSSSTIPAPEIFTASVGDKNVVIGWNTKDLDQHYTFYNILRRTPTTSFRVINKKPFMYMSDENDNSDFVYFSDSLSDNNTEYIYQVYGITSFGNYGPTSKEIHAVGKEPSSGIFISMTNVIIGNDFAKLSWHIYPDSLHYKINRIDIYRKINFNDSLEMINTIPLSSADTSFLINDLPQVSYYVIQATDIYDYTYQSVASMVQMVDTIPPSKPIGLIGKIRKDGLVIIDWTANTDSDIEGYKVLFSNRYDGEYSQLTSVHVVKPHYETTIDPQFMADSIYFKVFAIDHHYNMSQWSDPLSLKRPDVVAPSKSVINNLIAYENGIAIYWSLSSNKDIKIYELQRRLSNTPEWRTVLAFDKFSIPALAATGMSNIPDANFLDISDLSFNWYSYRIMVKDNSGNVSYSDEKKVFPFDSGIRGYISDFEGYIIPYMPNVDYFNLTMNPGFYNFNGGNLGASLTGNTIGFLTSNTNVNTPPNSGNYNMTLYKKAVAFKWKYKSGFQNLRSFKLYRRIVYQSTIGSNNSVDGGANANPDAFVLVATVDPETAAKLAEIAGLYKGFIYVDELPQRKSLHYEYKIKAEHSDGGFSQYSPIVTIQILGN